MPLRISFSTNLRQRGAGSGASGPGGDPPPRPLTARRSSAPGRRPAGSRRAAGLGPPVLRQPPAAPEGAPPRRQLRDHRPREEPGLTLSEDSGDRGPCVGRADARLRQQNGLVGPIGPPAALPRHLGPPPGSGFAFVPPPGSGLSQGLERVRGGRSPSGASNRLRRVLPGEGGSRAAAPPGARGSAGPAAGGPGRGARRERPAGRAERAPPRARGRGRGCCPWGAARKPACSKMVGFGLLYFFFCSLHFKEQKKKPNPSHHFICISQDQKPGLRGGRQLGRPPTHTHTPQPGEGSGGLGGTGTPVGTKARALVKVPAGAQPK
uniref:Uncharacterized protein n=1 Tax=Pipistrellus kuhlii TaxID=59472 RepID=A0A7J7ZJT5_PIPKU|nr:hypothetical protein mPipKuh1_009567 [Pipistrellus kuhlii]